MNEQDRYLASQRQKAEHIRARKTYYQTQSYEIKDADTDQDSAESWPVLPLSHRSVSDALREKLEQSRA